MPAVPRREEQSTEPDTLLSRRVQRIGLAPTVAMSVRAAELRAEGCDVIDLAIGELDFATPQPVIEAAHRAALDGFTRYTAPDGAPFVKDAVRQKLFRDNALAYERAEIHVASGAKQVISNAFAATLEEGDEAVIVAPSWVSYVDMVALHGGTPVLVNAGAEDAFIPDPDRIAAALTSRTKWVLINSPNNPTGAVYPGEILAAIARIVGEHPRAMLMSDEIYEHLIFDGVEHITLPAIAPAMRDRILVINGVSKSYAMTGWRIGFAAGPPWLITAMAKIQSQTAGSSTSISQAAAAEAMTGDQSLLPVWRASLQKRRDLALSLLQPATHLAPFRPAGAFYLFADVSRCTGVPTPDGRTLETDADVSAFLLETANVASVPGTAFGASPYIRLSFAVEDDRLAEACHRVVRACSLLPFPRRTN